ncbi:InlB B-repeat-containing protein [Candidatus Saccharibacteria bacterium]|nr:InlB B-repeat-containing protein [Candidatus Saccharibacteria bacterium]
MAFFVPLTLGLGYAAYQFLFPASSTSATTVSGAEVGLTIKDFIKLAVDTNNLVLVDSNGNTIISPSSTGTMITGDVNVAVTTNTAQGYSLSVYTEDNSTSMVHSNSTSTTSPVTDVIASIDTISGYNADTGAQDLSANTWGFRNRTTAGLSNWFAVGENESNGTVIANTNTGNSLYCEALSYPLESTNCDAGSYDTHSVNFGAKVTDTIAAGTYTNNVVFSAVAKSEGTRYTLQFNPNGGDNTMGPRTVVKGSTITLPRTGFVKAGYAIKGWALTQADAEAKTENPSTTTTTTNPTYSAGQTLEVTNLLLAAIEAGQSVEQNALINLYAIWGNQFNITLANGNTTAINTLTPAAGSHTYTLGSSVTITCTPNSGYHCTEWVSSNTSALPSKTGNETAGAFSYTFTMPANDVTLTANASANTYTINYDANTGSGTTNPTTVTYGQNVTLATNAFTAPSGKEFKEWNTSSDGNGTTYSSGQSGIAPATLKSDIATVNGGSITLYAIWDILKCSDTVHPTTSTACQMADGRMWILGNSGNKTYFNGICFNQTNTDGHDATCSSCPSGYNFPKITDFDTLIQAYGGTSSRGARFGYVERTGALYKVLGLSSGRYYWSSTEYGSKLAYYLGVTSGDSSSTQKTGKGAADNGAYVLCYK